MKTKDIKRIIKRPMSINTKKTKELTTPSNNTLTINSKIKQGGQCKFQLNTQDLNNITHLIKSLPKMEENITFMLHNKILMVGQNQDGIMALLKIKLKDTITQEPFLFSIPKEVLVNLNQVKMDEVGFEIEGTNLKIKVGDTVLDMTTIEDGNIPDIHIDTTDYKLKETLIPDSFENALYRLKVIKQGAIGVLENSITLSNIIEAGSSNFFTSVKTDLKKINVGVSTSFIDSMLTATRTAILQVDISQNKEHLLISNDVGFYYQTRVQEGGFTVTLAKIISAREKIVTFTTDKRNLATSLKKLSIVTTGIQEPTIKLKVNNKRRKLTLEVKSLNNKTSQDTMQLGVSKGKSTTIELRQDLLENALSILNNHIEIKIYEGMVSLEDDEQKILFGAVQ